MESEIEVELDGRRRLPLARIADGSHRRFRVRALPDGSFTLTPVVSISQRELDFLSDPEAVAGVRHGLEDMVAGRVTRYSSGHFQKLAAELGPDEDE